jgi:hypothetical protein
MAKLIITCATTPAEARQLLGLEGRDRVEL